MRKITADDLFEFHLVGWLASHPHRYEVAYQEQKANRETNHTDSWIMTVTPGKAPRQFTQGTTDEQPAFSPDGQQLAFLSKRSGTKQIWVMPVNGGEPRQATFLKHAVEEFRWRPDSRGFIYIALIGPQGLEMEDVKDTEDPYIQFNRDVKVLTEHYHKLDGIGYFDERRPHVVIQDLAASSHPRQLTQGPMRHSGLEMSADGRWILTASRYGEDYDRNAGRNHIYLLDAAGVKEPLALTQDPLSAHDAVFGPDGQTIYFLGANWEDLGYDNTALYRTTIQGEPATRLLAQWDRPLADASTFDMPGPASNRLTWDPDGVHLYILTSQNGTVQLARINVAQNRLTLVTTADQVHYSFALSHDAQYVALAATCPTNPAQVLWNRIEQNATEVLANPNETLLSQLILASPERLIGRSETGPELDVFVMKPADLKADSQAPALLEIHGGPMMMYAQSFSLEFQCLAAQGYGVVYGNPRGSQGYGKDFCTAIQQQWGHRDYEDLLAILDTALSHHEWMDPERLGVLGGSYGGYMTNWIVGHTNRFKAAITMRSVVDWRAMIGTGDLGWHWIGRANDVWPFDSQEDWYREQSPITYVKNITTPLLIEHQEGDLRCPIDQGMMLFTAMKYYDRAPVKFIRYPDEFHGMSRNGKPWHRVYRLHSFTDWFSRYLNPMPAHSPS